MNENIYTYRNGRRVQLIASPNRIVSRASRRDLIRGNFQITERLSPHSYRIAVPDGAVKEAVQAAQTLGASAYHDYWIPDDDGSFEGASEFRITDRILVTFRSPLSVDELTAFREKYDLSIDEEGTTNIRHGDPRRFLMRVGPSTDPVVVVRQLNEKERAVVRTAEHDVNHLVKPTQIAIPRDRGYRGQWHLHLHTTNDLLFTRGGSVRAEEAWKKLGRFGNRDVVIGVIDAAFDYEHPDIDADHKRDGFAYFDEYRLVASDDSDADIRVLREGPPFLINHGTACAALAAAGVDNRPVSSVGVAPACRLHLVKLPLDGMSSAVIADSQLVAAIRHLRDKVDVVTSSWEAVDPRIEWSDDLVEAITDAATHGGRRPGKGIVFFWGAGNSDRPLANDFTSAVPVPYEVLVHNRGIDTVRRARRFINNLVGLPNVIHVAASTSQGRRAHYSNYGYGIGLAAPSNNKDPFLTCTPAPGIPIRTSGFDGSSALTGEFGGTSAAAPIAAGVAALVISAHPEITAAETVSLLKQTAERDLDVTTQYPRAPVSCLGRNAAFDVSPVHPFEDGNFRPQGVDGTWSPWFGFGRVDALAAVTEAMRRAEEVSAAAVEVATV